MKLYWLWLSLGSATALQLARLTFQTRSSDNASQRAESAAQQLVWGGLFAGGIAIAVAVFLGLAIIRSITRPLTLAVEVADRVASGDLSGQITVQSKDEMGHLLSALQRMQQSLVKTVTSVRTNAQGVASAVSKTSTLRLHQSTTAHSPCACVHR